MHTTEKIKQQFIELVEKEKPLTPEQVIIVERIDDIDEIAAELIRRGVISVEKSLELKARVFGMEWRDMSDKEVKPALLNIIPQELAENYQVVALGQKENKLEVGIVNPTNLKAQEAVQFIARKHGLKVKFYIINGQTFEHIINQYAALSAEVKEALDIAQTSFKPIEEEDDEHYEIDEIIKTAPVSKMVSVILKHAVEQRASDVHIEPTLGSSRVRYRIDGELKVLLELPQYIHSAIVSRIKVLANLKIDETRRPQDGRIRMRFEEREIDFRISTLPLYEREKVVLRVLDTSSKTINLESLGFWGTNKDIILDNIKKPHGLLLVTGPTGSGKSTTLYSMLQILNKEEVNITTLEDPVEYYLTGVNQSQIRPEVSLTFATGLRSILRQDPDIVMVGEIRDNETAELAIHASLTGHVVLSTLHTNDALGAIPRLINMQIEPFLLASTINMTLAQRLVRKLCVHCKKEQAVPAELLQKVEKSIGSVSEDNLPKGFDPKKLIFYHSTGCPKCRDTGYQGRMAISEVVNINEEFKDIIAHGADPQKLEAALHAQGSLTMEQDGFVKALQGETSIEEVMRVTRE